MNAPVVIDIETKADLAWLADPQATRLWKDSLTPPANYKNPETINAWFINQMETRQESASLRPMEGKVVAIGVSPLWSNSTPECFADSKEPIVLRAFSEWVGNNGDGLCGWHIRRFDLPFITTRCALHGITLPEWWPHSKDYSRIIDGADYLGKGDLHLWAHRFELPAKSADGSQVAEMSIDEVRAYCIRDVEVERGLLRRLSYVIRELRVSQPERPTPAMM